MGLAFLLEARARHRQALEDLTERAHLVVTELLATRYVMAIHQDLINRDAEGRVEFKHLNPAAVGRLVGEHFTAATGYRLRQIRLEPRLEANRPQGAEYEILARAVRDRDPRPVWVEEVTPDGQRLFRYVMPLVIGPECLACHGGPAGTVDIAGFPREGYEVGDIGGAIALTLHMEPLYASLRSLLWQRLALWSVLLIATWAVVACTVRRLVGRPLAGLVEMTQAVQTGRWDRIGAVGGSREMALLSDRFVAMARHLQQHHRLLEQTVADRTEALRQAIAHLKQQARFKARFLETVGHELKTPLTAILAHAERLARREPQGAAHILVVGRLMESHLDDLLAAARLEEAGLPLRHEPVDLRAVCDDSLVYLSPLATQRQVHLGWCDADAASPELWVLGDGRRLLQVAINLVSNAIKATPPGGRVRLRGQATPTGVLVEVLDEGPGLPSAVEGWLALEAREAARQVGDGLVGGLGLSIARRLVEAHGGTLSCACDLGRPGAPPLRGACLQVWVPLADDAGEEEA